MAEGQDVLAGLGHQLSRPGEFGSEHGAHLSPLLKDRFFALLRKHRAQGSGNHLLVGFRHRLEQVPGEMHTAALPAAALQHSADRVDQTAVGIADDELDPCESSLLEGADELAPEALAFAVSDLETEQFPAAVGVDAHGDDNGSGADLHGSAQPAVEVGGIEVEVGVTLALQRPVQEGLHLQIDFRADAAHLRFRDPALAAQSCHQGINLACGDAGDIGLHHDGVEGLVHPPARLEDRGQEAAAAQFRDLEIDVTYLGSEQPGPVAVAVAKPFLTALMAIGTEHSSDLELDQLLQAVTHQLRPVLRLTATRWHLLNPGQALQQALVALPFLRGATAEDLGDGLARLRAQVDPLGDPRDATMAALAQRGIAVRELRLDVELRVIGMDDWQPEAAPGYGWPLAARSWVNPSPNAPNVYMARAYPGTVMLEGTTLSEGRGTTRPLEVWGAPDIDAAKVLKEMQRLAPQWLLGCRLRECWFEPTFHKHVGRLCHGVQVHTDDPHYDHARFRPWRLQALAFKAIRNLWPDYPLWRDFPYEYERERLAIDLINGSPLLREWVDDRMAAPGDLEVAAAADERAWRDSTAAVSVYLRMS